MISISEIQKFFKGKITLNEPLARFTTFRIGGVADYFVEPVDTDDVINIVKYASQHSIPYYVMGNGSNILISDDGIRGIVINLETGFNYLKNENGVIICGAGVKMARFADYCIQNSLSGVEMLAGIPATVGGALIMNAGAYGGETADYVWEVKVIAANKLKVLKKADCGFKYRTSGLKNSVVLEASFNLETGNKEEISRKRKELILHRNQAQPVEIPNAGCVFKNPKDNKAALLIQQCGLKGTTFGGAMVSHKHANFIVNFHKASANDVIELVKIVKNTVKNKTGIELEMEIKLIGFEEVKV
ncbi:MAG: UDP-N-acetylmuramate dehydrogenase [Ignavibacteria bacterium]|nr:UDP-N-acetylmuramate dehydrogenase [Ignavibacteria bacterium]